MNVAGLAPSSLLALSSLVKTGVSAAIDAFTPDEGSANSAGRSSASASIMPSSGGLQLSLDALISLQSADDPKPVQIEEMSAAEKFLQEAHKSPMQRMREQVLEQLGLSEEALAQMSPEERRAAEDKIRDMIEEKLRQAIHADDAPAQTNAQTLQTLA